MGFSGIGFSELLLLFVIVVLVFGTKKISTLGTDLGAAIRGFRQAMSEGEKSAENAAPPPQTPDSAPRFPPVTSYPEPTFTKKKENPLETHQNVTGE